MDRAALDSWLPDPAVCVSHGRPSSASPQRLWDAARAAQLNDTRLLGKLIRWRIPGTRAASTFEELFRSQPFLVLTEEDTALVSGLVGRIWTLRRDYPELADPEEYRGWSTAGTAKVLFANWVEAPGSDGAVLCSEARVQAFGVQGQVGLASVRPLIRGFSYLVGSDGIAAAVRRAERPKSK